MKKFVFPFVLGVCITSLFAYKTVYDIKRDSAEVWEYPKYNDLAVFTDCSPLMEHDTIGYIEPRFVLSDDYFKERDNMLQRTVKKYPKADGIIINMNPKRTTQAWVIQFKK